MGVARVRGKETKEEKGSDCFPPGSGSERDEKDSQLKNDVSLPFAQDCEYVQSLVLHG